MTSWCPVSVVNIGVFTILLLTHFALVEGDDDAVDNEERDEIVGDFGVRSSDSLSLRRRLELVGVLVIDVDANDDNEDDKV